MTAPPITRPADTLRHVRATYPRTPTAVSEVRELTHALPEPLWADAELVITELFTNSVRHADTKTVTVDVREAAGGGAHIEVSDEDATHLPRPGSPGSDATCGRGLMICKYLCSDLYCETTPHGKTVIADLS